MSIAHQSATSGTTARANAASVVSTSSDAETISPTFAIARSPASARACAACNRARSIACAAAPATASAMPLSSSSNGWGAANPKTSTPRLRPSNASGRAANASGRSASRAREAIVSLTPRYSPIEATHSGPPCRTARIAGT